MMENKKRILFFVGRPLSPLYSVLMHLRQQLYLKGVLRVHRFDIPIVSVGNLTLGGTGKTPMVQYLARLLQNNGYSPAVISRGYGGASRSPVNIVSDGSQLLLSAAIAGDEPRFLAETLPGVPVLTGPVRRLPAERAVAMGATVLLLDDGFQHMQVARDVNLVLFNADTLAGNSRVFPGGDLREPVKALHRATGFLLTSVNVANQERADRFTALLSEKFPNIPVTQAGFEARSLVQLSESGGLQEVDDGELEGKTCFGFCGIANPGSFSKSLDNGKFVVAGFQAFADHHSYKSLDIQGICSQAKSLGADCLLTTEKDLVKLTGHSIGLPLYAQRMEAKLSAAFDQRLRDQVAAFSPVKA